MDDSFSISMIGLATTHFHIGIIHKELKTGREKRGKKKKKSVLWQMLSLEQSLNFQ